VAAPCTCPSGSAGKKVGAAALVGVALFAAGHAKPGHAAKATAAVVADVARPAADNRGLVAVAFARAQLGKPYEWGGEGPGSFDCSGLAYEAWRRAGVKIPRTTFTQWPALRHIGRGDLQPGDLIFYAGSDGSQSNPGHVVMYVGGGWVIQAFETGTNVMLTRLADVNAGALTGFARPGGA
jgi:cell wall-associated NlpC family hydrolase